MTTELRIEKKESFRVVGYSLSTTNQKKEGRKKIPAFWENFKNKHLENELFPFMNKEPKGLFGISHYNTDNQDAKKFNYYIAVSSDISLPANLSEYQVPAALWAIFPCTLETMGKTQVQAITKWLPKAHYKPLNRGYITGKMKAQAPDIEYYGNDGYVEIWIAVQKK